MARGIFDPRGARNRGGLNAGRSMTTRHDAGRNCNVRLDVHSAHRTPCTRRPHSRARGCHRAPRAATPSKEVAARPPGPSGAKECSHAGLRRGSTRRATRVQPPPTNQAPAGAVERHVRSRAAFPNLACASHFAIGAPASMTTRCRLPRPNGPAECRHGPRRFDARPWTSMRNCPRPEWGESPAPPHPRGHPSHSNSRSAHPNFTAS